MLIYITVVDSYCCIYTASMIYGKSIDSKYTYSYTHSLTTSSYSQRNSQISARIGDDPSNQQNWLNSRTWWDCKLSYTIPGLETIHASKI